MGLYSINKTEKNRGKHGLRDLLENIENLADELTGLSAGSMKNILI